MPSNPATASPRGSLAIACERLWQIEKESGLVDRRVAGVQYWPLIRQAVLTELFQRRWIDSEGRARRPYAMVRRGLAEIGPLTADILRLGIGLRGQFDVVLMPLRRKQWTSRGLLDHHTEQILSNPDLGRVALLDQSRPIESYSQHARAVVGDRGRLRSHIIARASLKALGLMSAMKAERAFLNAAIGREFGATTPMSAMQLALRLAYFMEGRIVMRRMLKRSGARRLIFIGTHTNCSIAAAARDLEIETFEVQHGALTPYHLTHHYPGRPRIESAADWVLLYGQFWADYLEFPSNTRTAVIGSANVAMLRERVARVPRRVVVPSHAPTDSKLYDAVVATARAMPDWEFIFRPHPIEDFGFYQTRLEGAVERPKNLRLSSKSEDVYTLLTSADVQIGVCSTTLFEGMSLGLRTIVLDLGGRDVMNPALARGDAILVHDNLPAALNTAPVARDPYFYYASPAPSLQVAIDAARPIMSVADLWRP